MTEETKPQVADTPEQVDARWYQWPLYSWVGPLLDRGKGRVQHKELLTEDDLLRLPDFECPQHNADFFTAFWEEELRTYPQDPKLSRALRKAFGTRIYVGGVFRLTSDTASFCGPFLLQGFIRWLSDPNATPWEGFLWAAALTVGNFVTSTCLNAATHQTQTGFTRMSTALMVKVYEAALEHPVSHDDTGTLTNAHAADTAKFPMMALFLHGLWAGPILVVACNIALYFFVGWASLVAFGLLMVSLPFQTIFTTQIAKYVKQHLTFAKVTIGAVNEALQGVRICKFMNWEEPFKQRIAEARSNERSALGSTLFFKSTTMVITNATPLLIIFTMFVVAAKLGEPLSPDRVFPALAMVMVMRVPLMFFTQSFAKVAELQFSTARIQRVLMGTRRKPHKVGVEYLQNPVEHSIEVKNVTVYTNDNNPLMTFDDVTVPKGKLTMIVGCTGSGKTTLVNTMLGEVKVKPSPDEGLTGKGGKKDSQEEENQESRSQVVGDGEPLALEARGEEPLIALSGGVAFVPQESWLMNATIERNVTLGELPGDHDFERYVECLTVCSLLTDLEQLEDGDETQVGERGITLSGGQKQRISLARAAYSRQDIVVMDDPLSAVDPHVRKGLFFDCILGLMQNKTRVLVTHQTQFLPFSDKIIQIDVDHNIVFQGTYMEYAEKGFTKKSGQETGMGPDGSPGCTPQSTLHASPQAREKEQPQYEKKKGKGLSTIEKNVVGTVSWDVYLWYFGLGGWGLFASVLFVLVLWRAAHIVTDLWLTWWSSKASPFGYHYEEDDYIMWFGIFIVVTVLCMFVRLQLYNKLVLRVVANAHQKLIASLIHAPVSFYDTTPMGRILNRCGKDIECLDLKVPETVLIVQHMLIMVVSLLVVVSFTTPYFLAAIPFMSLAYRWVYLYYTHTVRGLKRLEGSTRSPFMTMMNETIGGLSTIRAYNCTAEFSKEHIRRATVAVRPVYNTRSSQRWICSRTEFMGSGILFATSMLASMAHVVGDASWNTSNNPAMVALTVTYAMAATHALMFLTRVLAELESDMSSTERVKEYSETIPQEKTVVYGDQEGQHKAPSKEWPAEGGITFHGVQLRYREELPLVLKGIDLEIKGGEKVGVVGRTGSGKSTIMLALFRMVELAGGSIKIDGHDISNLTMNDLRKNITIIPQDPTLFQGSVRSNLDPFNLFDDRALWELLGRVNLQRRVLGTSESSPNLKTATGTVRATTPQANNEPIAEADDVPLTEEEQLALTMKAALAAPVAEKGSNFSVGERQLMCLARALLKKSKILLLDEATASVDFEADELIQRTIRSEFAECTVLTIAHRLATVVDSDKLLVLDEGLVAEFDSPKSLLGNEDSIFTSMAAQLGAAQFEELRVRANNEVKEVAQE